MAIWEIPELNGGLQLGKASNWGDFPPSHVTDDTGCGRARSEAPKRNQQANQQAGLAVFRGFQHISAYFKQSASTFVGISCHISTYFKPVPSISPVIIKVISSAPGCCGH